MLNYIEYINKHTTSIKVNKEKTHTIIKDEEVVWLNVIQLGALCVL